jgi:RNA polymerase sigma factor (sigma-70 family)
MTVSEDDWRDCGADRRRAAEGDPLAWERLFTWLWPWTVQLAGSEDGAMRGWQKIIVRPSLWLRDLRYFATVFKNAGRDQDRAERRERARVNAFRASLGAQASPPLDTSVASLKRALERLSPDKKELLRLYLEGCSLEEIAVSSGTPYGTLRRRIKEAINALRNLMLPGQNQEGLTPAL